MCERVTAWSVVGLSVWLAVLLGRSVPAQQIVRVAWQGQPLTNGPGTIVPRTWANSCGVARTGAVAFVCRLAGGARNQAVCVADDSGVRAIAVGCGVGGGSGVAASCGDQAPGGGTLAGLFEGSAFAPAIDDVGNVLFLADVHGGPSPRALFLFDAAAAAVVRVAAIGDPAPGGGTLAAVGPGVLADGVVTFAARRTGVPVTAGAELFGWRDGALFAVARLGDPAPGGGVFAALATESLLFADGSSVPIGPLPTCNECGAVAFAARSTALATGTATSGIVVRNGAADLVGAWAVRAGDPAPGGGTFAAFGAPVINGNGAIAVFAEVARNGGADGGWFVGDGRGWRRALGFFDPVGDGQCHWLATSRAPMAPLDDDGNLVVWCDLAPAGGRECIVDCRADGSRRLLIAQGQSAPDGGVFAACNAWPTRTSSGRVLVSAAVAGGAAADGHFAVVVAEPRVAVAPCVRRGRTAWVFDQGPLGSAFVLAVSPSAVAQPMPPWGALELGSPTWVLTWFVPCLGAARPHAQAVPVPTDAALAGAEFHFQSLMVGQFMAELTNRASTAIP